MSQGSDDSFYISIDEDQVLEWRTGRHQQFEWEPRTETTDVEGGLHKLVVHTREDGTKLRAIRFSAGGCGFIPSTNALPSAEPASYGVLAGTFQTMEDYIVTGGVGPIGGAAAAGHCLLPQPASDHTQWFALTPTQQAGAQQMGWTEESWTCFRFNSHQGGISASQSNGQWTTADCDVPVGWWGGWAGLTPTQQAGGTALGCESSPEDLLTDTRTRHSLFLLRICDMHLTHV